MPVENIPKELQELQQWILWRYESLDGKLTKIPYSYTGKKASVVDTATWTSFDTVCATFDSGHRYSGIGFVFTANDPFAGIDIDYHEEDTYRKTVGNRVLAAFESYTEISPSGKGLHIIVKGTIDGARRQGIEAYSKERYFTMTGNVFRDLPIADCQPMLDELQKDLMPTRQLLTLLNTTVEQEPDHIIIDRMLKASNGAKARALAAGDTSVLNGGDKSGSAIDQALVNMFQFYTKNVEQIDRLWLSTPHAQARAKKMLRPDYRLRTIGQAFDREVPPLDLSAILAKKTPDAVEQSGESLPTIGGNVHATSAAQPDPTPVPEVPQGLTLPIPIANPYTFPPGVMGEIAEYIYKSSARPVMEISIAGAIALMAGIAGKAWNVSKSGLNLYILALAKTGRGKDAISNGINSLIQHCVNNNCFAASKFIGPSNINSGQALSKYIGSADSRSFISIIGEFGVELQEISSRQANGAQKRLLRELLDLYGKSGNDSVIGSSIYSDKRDSVDAIKAPNVSIIGESTQYNLYKALDENMITSGLLPRFLIIAYDGIRVPLNENRLAIPERRLIDSICNIIIQASQNINKGVVTNVRLDPEAQEAARHFDRVCDWHINNPVGEHTRISVELWNRAHMKTLRLAALIAVGMNMYQPCITIEAWQWAFNIVVADINGLLKKFDAGEINTSVQQTQWDGLMRGLKTYVNLEPAKFKGSRITPEMHKAGIVPYSFLMQRLSNIMGFKEDRQNFRLTLKNALDMAVSSGVLQLAYVEGSSASYYQIIDYQQIMKVPAA